jgi:outer membrane protein assembly factor BamB
MEITAFHPLTGHIVESWEFTVPFQYGGPWYWPIMQTRDTQGNSYLLVETEKNILPFSGHLQFGDYSPGRGLRVIDANTGQELWQYQYGENHVSVSASNGDYLAVVTDAGEEYAVQFLAMATVELRAQISLPYSDCRMLGNRLLIEQPGEYILTNPFE